MAGVPQLSSDYFSIKELKKLWGNNIIHINEEYQRSYIWKPRQRSELIESIMKGYSIGVLVVWKNKQDQYEILDGQQRIRAIMSFLNGDVKNNKGKKYSELTYTEQAEVDAYRIYYLDLKSNLTEEQISDIFTRLQEGTPLNIAEKVNAFRGEFRKGFINAFLIYKRFFEKIDNYRFRARFLAAQLLFLELETDPDKRNFPNLKYEDFKALNEKYKNYLPKQKYQKYKNYLTFLGFFLNNQLGAISPRDLISIYLLTSYLHKRQVNQKGIGVYMQKFVIEFMKNLTSFSIYDTSPPSHMSNKLFKKYMKYKQNARKANTADSLLERFKFILAEYKRIFPSIRFKDKIRLFNEEEKIKIYFTQNALCHYCKNPLDFLRAQCHHKKEHSKGGPTKIFNGQMIHENCHKELHKMKFTKIEKVRAK